MIKVRTRSGRVPAPPLFGVITDYRSVYSVSWQFLILVNKMGQTRLARYFEELSIADRTPMEAEIVRKCLARKETQVRKRSQTDRIR